MFPPDKDSVLNRPRPKGALAVTEFAIASSNCQYIELIASNCRGDANPYVDVNGWIIDDNSGNFGDNNCDPNLGNTPSHYRLAVDNPIWQNVPVGSVIVLYNQGGNCYNLSDTFYIDSTNNIYWVPVPTSNELSSYVLERMSDYTGDCAYCPNGDGTAYAPADNWENTIDLNPDRDAVQVRCPGCNSVNSNGAPFYHGVGFGSDSSPLPIAPDQYSIGGAAMVNPFSNFKFEYLGHSVEGLLDNGQWTISPSDALGSAPATLGFVNTDLFSAVVGHTLNFPCCDGSTGRENKNSGTASGTTAIGSAKAIGKVSVYPNPTATTLNFDFPMANKTELVLMDVTSRVIDKKTVRNQTSAVFNVKNLAAGLYIYEVRQSGNTTTGKVVVQK